MVNGRSNENLWLCLFIVWAKQRKLMALSIYSQANQEEARFELAGAWPASYKMADFNARSTDLHIEELEIAFEEFKRVK